MPVSDLGTCRELDRLELDEEHFLVLKNEYYLLRMTKNMQDFLKHGRNASQESVKSQLNAKKDSLHRVRSRWWPLFASWYCFCSDWRNKGNFLCAVLFVSCACLSLLDFFFVDV